MCVALTRARPLCNLFSEIWWNVSVLKYIFFFLEEERTLKSNSQQILDSGRKEIIGSFNTQTDVHRKRRYCSPQCNCSVVLRFSHLWLSPGMRCRVGWHKFKYVSEEKYCINLTSNWSLGWRALREYVGSTLHRNACDLLVCVTYQNAVSFMFKIKLEFSFWPRSTHNPNIIFILHLHFWGLKKGPNKYDAAANRSRWAQLPSSSFGGGVPRCSPHFVPG